jgi:hypothetical protein
MRTAALLLMLTVGFAGAVMPTADLIAAPQSAPAAEPAAAANPPRADVDIDINRGGGAWYTSPTWIAIGVIALVLLIVVVALAARGGGTTIIRE